MKIKSGVEKYVGVCKRLFTVFACVTVPLFMVCLVFACARYLAFCFIAPAVGIAMVVVYALYASRISLGTVIGYETTDRVVHLKTKRKIFTYDAEGGCVSVKTYRNKFVAVFRTQDSQDQFIFPRRVPFSKYYEEQFTAEDVCTFYPAYSEAEG